MTDLHGDTIVRIPSGEVTYNHIYEKYLEFMERCQARIDRVVSRNTHLRDFVDRNNTIDTDETFFLKLDRMPLEDRVRYAHNLEVGYDQALMIKTREQKLMSKVGESLSRDLE